MSRFVLNVFSQLKFWRRHCSTGLERNSCMKSFLMFPPPTKILAPPLYTVRVYILYIYFVTCAPPNFYTRRTPWYEYIRFRRRILILLIICIPCSSILLTLPENSPRNKLTSTYLSSLSLFRQHLQVQ